jgi:hypothetical protein
VRRSNDPSSATALGRRGACRSVAEQDSDALKQFAAALG